MASKASDMVSQVSSSFTAWLISELINLNKTHSGFITLEYFLAHMLNKLHIHKERYPLSSDLFELLEENNISSWDEGLLRWYMEEKIIFLKQEKFVECDKEGRLLATNRAKKQLPRIEKLMNELHGSTCSGEFADERIIQRYIERLKRDEITVNSKVDSQLTTRRTMEDYSSSLAVLKQRAIAFENTVAKLDSSFENKKQLLFADQAVRKLLVSVTRSLGLESKYAEGLNININTTKSEDIPNIPNIPMLRDIKLSSEITEFIEAVNDVTPKFKEAVKTQESYSVTTLASEMFHVVQQKLREVFKVEQPSFKITKQCLDCLKAEDVPDKTLEKLRSLQNESIPGEKELLDILKKTIGDEPTVKFQSLIIKHADDTPIVSFYMGSKTTNPGVQWTAKGHAKTSGLGGSPGRPSVDSSSQVGRLKQGKCDIVTPTR